MLQLLYILCWITCFQSTISLAERVDTTSLEFLQSEQIFQSAELAPKVLEKEFYIDSDMFGQPASNTMNNFQNKSQLKAAVENDTFTANASQNVLANQMISDNFTREGTENFESQMEFSKNQSVQDLIKRSEAAEIELELKEKISAKLLTEHASKRSVDTPVTQHNDTNQNSSRRAELLNLVKKNSIPEHHDSTQINNEASQMKASILSNNQNQITEKKQKSSISNIDKSRKTLSAMEIRVSSLRTQNSIGSTNTTQSETNPANATKIITTKVTQWKLNNWWSVLTLASLGVIAIVAIQLASYIGSLLNADLLKTLNSISRDIIIIAILVIIAGLINYYDLLQFVKYYVNFEAVSLGVLLFGLLWAVLGLFLAALAHVYIREWRSFEAEYPKRDAIFRQYEDLYYNSQRSDGLNAELKHRRRQLEFFLMRQDFITPSFLPVYGEDFSRDDFDFSAYLTKCICKVNQQAFRFDITTFVTIAMTAGLCTLGYYYIKHLLFKILIATPIVLYFPLRLLARKMTRLYSQLVTIVKSPYDADLAKFENLRQPSKNLEKLSMPTYLSRRFPLSEFRERWYDMTQPSRHILLYWLHSPGFIIRVLHAVLVMHVEWLAYFILDLSFGIEKFDSYYYYWIGVGIAILVSLINLFYTLPHILKLSAITNNIQMLKDKKLRREVCEEKIQQRQKAMQNIYSVLKSVRRQSLALGKDVYLRLYIVNHVREIFKELRGPNNDKAITYNRLITLAHLCGRDFTEREAMILAHDITCRNPANMTFDEFMEAIEKIFVDVGSNPVEVSKAVIKSLSNTVSSTVSSKTLRTALEKLDLFETRDIDVLMHEVKYLPIEHAQHSISSIAALIRDSIEGMPR